MNIIDELSWRGAVNQMTDEEGLRKLTEEKSVSLYCGVDPTGDSMHIGHLIPLATRAAVRRNVSCRLWKRLDPMQKN